eukprot:CAMPEP_0183587082 /NCGR_PEP_ID=MMETSP0371-20130417/158333_1 /TAXON_ID=268820 /ORGANISM="Peridinium aciculiferum, Strain PAER-2" /LENGTH=57 /DNA_ID=CAMNT_0025798233 /DNA_START=83 /DNA_END=254 /DNA_ORIENTATION=-
MTSNELRELLGNRDAAALGVDDAADATGDADAAAAAGDGWLGASFLPANLAMLFASS